MFSDFRSPFASFTQLVIGYSLLDIGCSDVLIVAYLSAIRR